MKKLLLVATVLAASFAGAQAADLPSRKAPPPVYMQPVPVANWTGFYVGANLGYGWMEKFNKGVLFAPGLADPHGGVVGGGQVGFNYQVAPWLVAGLETDFQGTSIGGGAVARHTPWFGTVRGRLGFTPINPNLMIYATGGFAYGKLNIGPFANGMSFGQVATGWTAGGGLEYALSPNWSVKAEYLFVSLSGNYPTGPLFTTEKQSSNEHVVRVGLNYRFNMGGPTAVVAKY